MIVYTILYTPIVKVVHHSEYGVAEMKNPVMKFYNVKDLEKLQKIRKRGHVL